MTAETELTVEPWNGGMVQTVELGSFHLRIWQENNWQYSSSFNSPFPSNKIDNFASCYTLFAYEICDSAYRQSHMVRKCG